MVSVHSAFCFPVDCSCWRVICCLSFIATCLFGWLIDPYCQVILPNLTRTNPLLGRLRNLLTHSRQ